MGKYYVYILRCKDGSYYTGITVDLEKRVKEHNGELRGGGKYTRSKRPVELVFSEEAADRASAGKREAEIKKLERSGKEKLIGV